MKIANLFALSVAVVLVSQESPLYADVLNPSGGSPATQPSGVAGAKNDDNDDGGGGCSVAFVRNTSAVAAGVIAAALALGMARLRRYGIKRTY